MTDYKLVNGQSVPRNYTIPATNLHQRFHGPTLRFHVPTLDFHGPTPHFHASTLTLPRPYTRIFLSRNRFVRNWVSHGKIQSLPELHLAGCVLSRGSSKFPRSYTNFHGTTLDWYLGVGRGARAPVVVLLSTRLFRAASGCIPYNHLIENAPDNIEISSSSRHFLYVPLLPLLTASVVLIHDGREFIEIG